MTSWKMMTPNSEMVQIGKGYPCEQHTIFCFLSFSMLPCTLPILLLFLLHIYEVYFTFHAGNSACFSCFVHLRLSHVLGALVLKGGIMSGLGSFLTRYPPADVSHAS